MIWYWIVTFSVYKSKLTHWGVVYSCFSVWCSVSLITINIEKRFILSTSEIKPSQSNNMGNWWTTVSDTCNQYKIVYQSYIGLYQYFNKIKRISHHRPRLNIFYSIPYSREDKLLLSSQWVVCVEALLICTVQDAVSISYLTC